MLTKKIAELNSKGIRLVVFAQHRDNYNSWIAGVVQGSFYGHASMLGCIEAIDASVKDLESQKPEVTVASLSQRVIAPKLIKPPKQYTIEDL